MTSTQRRTICPIGTLVLSTLSLLAFCPPAEVYAQVQTTFAAEVLSAHPELYLDFNDSTAPFRDQISNASFTASDTGTILPLQPGFDATQPENKSASFSYNAYLRALSNATGDFEWNHPFSFLFQVDDLQYTHSGTMYFLSKGDVGSSDRPWYSLTMRMNAGEPQLCFTINGTGGEGSNPISQPSVCTHPGVANFANGYNYSFVISNDGTGAPDALKLSVNGFAPPYPVYGNYATYRFGAIVVSVGKTGAGYGDTTPFKSAGGGSNCVVEGSLNSQKGIPTSVSYTSNWGCTSVPAITLIAPKGVGATLTATLFGSKMSTASTYPMIVGGAEINGRRVGIAGTGPTAAPQLIDEFAVFPSALTEQNIHSLFYKTKFYQKLLKAKPLIPRLLVFDNDGCLDPDNVYALALVIAAQELAYVKILGVIDSDGSGASMAMYREMLDEAGLKQTPLGVPSMSAASSTLCRTEDVYSVDPTVSESKNGYESATTVYRSILSANPTSPVDIILGGSFRGVSDLMESSPDSISGLTGADLVARNAKNGGLIYAQGLGCCGSFSTDNSLEDWTAGQYVVTHNGKMPILWFGGSPQSSGPGVLYTRSAEDPVYVFAHHLGTDTRQAYDSLPTSTFLSHAFAGGITVAISGEGRGYADITPLSSVGGGSTCAVTGSMTSSGGVPASVEYPGGEYAGVGSGCSSAPVVKLISPTGSGASLVATSTITCGTVSITGPHSGTTSDATCSGHYFLPYSSLASRGTPTIFTWFLNSLIDPEPTILRTR